MSDMHRDYMLEAERQIAAAAEREIKLEARLMGAHREVGALSWETSDLKWKLEKANEAISELRAMLERAHTDLEAA